MTSFLYFFDFFFLNNNISFFFIQFLPIYSSVSFFIMDNIILGLFFLGLIHVCLNTRHIIFTYIGLEITFFSLVLLFSLIAYSFYSVDAYIIAFLLLVMVAADSVMGLALLILYKQYWITASIMSLNFSRR